MKEAAPSRNFVTVGEKKKKDESTKRTMAAMIK